MAVTNFTPLLGLALPTTGDLSGTWGTTVNTAITDLLDDAVAGTVTLSANADVTLTTTNGADNQARNAVILWTASNGATTRNITAPAQSKAYIVINAGTGSIVIRGAGPTTGVTVASGFKALVAWNGSDFVKVASSLVSLTSDVTGTLPVANGGTGLTAGTSGGVLGYTASGTLASSVALTANALVLGGGAGATPTPMASLGTTTTVLHGNAAGAPTFGAVSLTADVTGTLPIANGGTGLTSTPANGALDIGNGTGFTRATLTQGTGISITNASGAITIAATGTVSAATPTALGTVYGATSSGSVYTTALGYNAGAAITSGTYTVALGYGALAANTSGDRNIGIGGNALSVNTTGGQNIAIGLAALSGNTTASSNTAVGYLALTTNSTGASNTALGHSALQANTTASYNTAVGYQALYSTVANSIGLTAIGYQAGLNFTAADTFGASMFIGFWAGKTTSTGTDNHFIGSQSGQLNTTGSFNTGVGLATLQLNTTGSNNYASGYQALRSNTTGNSSTAVGYQAGYTNTTGGSGVYLGYQAGYTTNATYGNVCIGYRVGYSLTGGGNTLVGGLSTAGGDGAGTALTTGTQNSFFGTSAGNVVTTGSKNVIIGSYSGNQGSLDIRTASNYVVLSDGDGNPRGIFDSSGNLLVGTTGAINNASTFSKNASGGNTFLIVNSAGTNPYGMQSRFTGVDPNNTAACYYEAYNSFSSTMRFEVRSNGGIANYSANNVNLSDRREKTNFAPAGSYLNKICAIPVQTFNYIDQNLEEDGGLTLGVIAQDVQAVAPELVMESNWAGRDDEPKMRLSIYQTDLQYALMKAIQELKAEFDAYKATHP